MQELLHKRSRHEKYFDLGNGQIQMIQQKGLHYHDGAAWQDFDGNFEYDTTLDSKGKKYGHKVKKAQHNIRISEGMLRFGFEKGVWVEYGLPSIPADVEGNIYILPEAWPNADIRLTVFPEGIKNDAILKAPGLTSVAFPIQTTGCTLAKEGNSITFYRQGQPIGSIPAPYAEDANGDVGHVALDYDGENIRFVPDPIWLANAVYPVMIDPTTTLQPDATEGLDTYISSGTPTGNFGTAVVIKASTIAYSLIKLTLNLPQNTIINSAILNLYNQLNSISGGAGTLYATQITSAWDESTVTWNTTPSFTANNATDPKYSFLSGRNRFEPVDITGYVQGWINGTIANYGVVIRVPSAGGIEYSSSDNSTAANRPKLVLTYTEVAAGSPTSVSGLINALGRRLIA